MSYQQSLIPSGTVVKCKLLSCERIQHTKGEEKNQYKLTWEVTEGPFSGRVLIRNLWDTPKGMFYLRKDSRTLNVGHPEELIWNLNSEVLIEGAVSVNEYQGQAKNELCRIDKRLLFKTSNSTTEPLGDDPYAGAF